MFAISWSIYDMTHMKRLLGCGCGCGNGRRRIGQVWSSCLGHVYLCDGVCALCLTAAQGCSISWVKGHVFEGRPIARTLPLFGLNLTSLTLTQPPSDISNINHSQLIIQFGIFQIPKKKKKRNSWQQIEVTKLRFLVHFLRYSIHTKRKKLTNIDTGSQAQAQITKEKQIPTVCFVI